MYAVKSELIKQTIIHGVQSSSIVNISQATERGLLADFILTMAGHKTGLRRRVTY